METAVRKATRLEYRPPKQKHLITLRNITLESPSSIEKMLKLLEKRLGEGYWIITFKVLIILHYLIREGNTQKVAEAICMRRPQTFDISKIKNKKLVPGTIQNIYLYKTYLDRRVTAVGESQIDYTKSGTFRRLALSEGLFEETIKLQQLLACALSCKFCLNEGDPAISLFAYRLVIEDIFNLFQAVNESIINILEHYFEMTKSDALMSIELYKTFSTETQSVTEFFNAARPYEGALEMKLPPLNHAPTTLIDTLKDYIEELDKPSPEITHQDTTGVNPKPFPPRLNLPTDNNPFAALDLPPTNNELPLPYMPIASPTYFPQPSSPGVSLQRRITNPFSPVYMQPTGQSQQLPYDTNPFRAMCFQDPRQDPFSSTPR
ncbi:GAT-like domain-containing protein [Rhizopus microsporus ATCC 52813]|uniref:GAT-like domain-containing protein n=1 Tax=Rhizopus microsporus ATCC 52813 TaxID=1340429 RepID=A0A2G4SFG6_RHIZD|nr:GAT-like domain-containing protein [Rhizopus microsporus ATCC 52813]PHZ07515.1 GAT-like domain-containing protein [Rhizopus microsporus ATCC 52813]